MIDGPVAMVLIGAAIQAAPPARAVLIYLRDRSSPPEDARSPFTPVPRRI